MSYRNDGDNSFDHGDGSGDSPLDARLRGAYRRQLDDVQRQVGDQPYAAELQSAGPKTSSRILVAAAAVILGVMGVAAGNRFFSGSDAEAVETGPSATADESSQAPTESTPLTQVPPTLVPSTSALGADADGTDAGAGADDQGNGDAESATENNELPQTTTTVGPSRPAIGEETTTITTTTEPSPAPTGTQTVPAAISSGVANDVCPSGARAELEWASLQYVGASRGWGRLEDLVDEQDGPFYFEAWEPGFPDTVAVQLVLDQPVLISEIRVALNPSNPMTGTIFIDAGGQSVELELAGAGEWQVHTFDQQPLVDRLRIERRSAESDITELLVCVAPNQ